MHCKVTRNCKTLLKTDSLCTNRNSNIKPAIDRRRDRQACFILPILFNLNATEILNEALKKGQKSESSTAACRVGTTCSAGTTCLVGTTCHVCTTCRHLDNGTKNLKTLPINFYRAIF